jgi:glycerophosphoryl diester phosphodiesterase
MPWQPPEAPLLIGHRGARRYAPENTIAAFDLALTHGCDGIEFDVRLTGDGRAVVCHDPRISRLDVANSNYEKLALLRRVTASPVLHAAHDGAATAVQMASVLPCLEDVIERYASRAFLYLELKVTGIESCVLDALRAHPPERGYVVASFLPDVIRKVHAIDAEVSLGLIADKLRDLARWKELPVAAVMPHHSLVSQDLVDTLHFARKQVMVWTVNSERQMHSIANMGVDAIVSDDTQRLCRAFRRVAG